MAANEEIKTRYKPTIGIESHVQLNSKTKLFSAVGNDARQASPNTLITHIDVGMPGALPVLNEGALKLAARAAYALGATPQKRSHFDRKHYFYPDLPKGYQITQYSDPIISGGKVDIEVDGQTKTIKITRAHLEEDAGKNIHPDGVDHTLVDLNRAGTPLLEIVSEPDINSPREAKAFARELYLLMKYSGVSDVDLYHGNLRFDVNISVSSSDQKGTRTEVKNLNSFRSVEAAIQYEIDRQIEVLDKGETVIQETRGWDEAKQKTVAQRGKEEAHDYRYFPDPDLPPLELSEDFIAEIEKDLPMLPPAIRKELAKLGVEGQVIEDILDRPAAVPHILTILEKATPADARRAAFWIIHTQPSEADQGEQIPTNLVDPQRTIELSAMVERDELSSTAARNIYEKMLSDDRPPKQVGESLNLLQISDESEIEKIVQQVINDNPKAAEDIRDGETRAIGFLVGQVMAASQGKANPAMAQEIIKRQLGI
jgi:aspartyl-tRNA(Asn)/glutamyl-tRNA(Gln) amidotransferase subunit B